MTNNADIETLDRLAIELWYEYVEEWRGEANLDGFLAYVSATIDDDDELRSEWLAETGVAAATIIAYLVEYLDELNLDA